MSTRCIRSFKEVASSGSSAVLPDGLDQIFTCFDFKKSSCSQIFVNSIKCEIKLEVQHYFLLLTLKTDSICKVITN